MSYLNPTSFLEHIFLCPTCGPVELNKWGYCSVCGSDNLMPFHKPEPEHPKPPWQTPPQFNGAI